MKMTLYFSKYSLPSLLTRKHKEELGFLVEMWPFKNLVKNHNKYHNHLLDRTADATHLARDFFSGRGCS